MSVDGCDHAGCLGTVCVLVRDSTAPGGFAHLCRKHWPSWQPPPEDAAKVAPYVRRRRKRRSSG